MLPFQKPLDRATVDLGGTAHNLGLIRAFLHSACKRAERENKKKYKTDMSTIAILHWPINPFLVKVRLWWRASALCRDRKKGKCTSRQSRHPFDLQSWILPSLFRIAYGILESRPSFSARSRLFLTPLNMVKDGAHMTARISIVVGVPSRQAQCTPLRGREGGVGGINCPLSQTGGISRPG